MARTYWSEGRKVANLLRGLFFLDFDWTNHYKHYSC